jgi:signal transduction histidine kinase/ActR/RegA family two-component response regulator
MVKMAKKEGSRDPSRLRMMAEARVAKDPQGTLLAARAVDPARLIHVLQVHQIELEMQNEELNQAKDELAAILDDYTELYDFAPVGYLTLDAAGTVLRANLTAASLLGIPRSELLGVPFPGFLADGSLTSFKGFLHDRFSGPGPASLDLACLPSPGRVSWIRIEASAAASCLECRMVFMDISELVRLTRVRQIESEQFQAKKLEAVKTMAAGVAHNINNILAVVMSTAGSREELTGSEEELKADQIIEAACKRGRDVVRSMIQLTQTSLSDAEPVELHVLIAELPFLLESSTRDRIKVVAALSPEPLWIVGNAGILSSALMNLCLNAIDAMPDGGSLTLRTTVLEKDWIGVSVEDNGAGMTAEILERAMEPFFTTKPVNKGTGLGLSMVHTVIHAHGGSMAISSQPAQGTVVAIRLPRIPAPVEDATIEPEAPGLGNLGILLVDDDDEVRILVSRMLKAGGLAVTLAEGGKEAQALLRSGPLPDLVILDQNMPGMDGIATLKAIRILHPDLPVLISSGRPDVEHLEGFRQPNVGFLAKPFNLAELKAKLVKMNLGARGGRQRSLA